MWAIIGIFSGVSYAFEESDAAVVAVVIVGIVASLGYLVASNMRKKVARLRIVRMDGEHIDWGRGILRAVVLVVGLGFFWFDVVTVIMVCIRDDRRGLHDFASGTMVVAVV